MKWIKAEAVMKGMKAMANSYRAVCVVTATDRIA